MTSCDMLGGWRAGPVYKPQIRALVGMTTASRRRGEVWVNFLRFLLNVMFARSKIATAPFFLWATLAMY